MKEQAHMQYVFHRKAQIALLVICVLGLSYAQKSNFSLFNTVVEGLLNHDVPELSVNALHTNKSLYTVVDCRTKVEYDVSHIQGAIHIDSLHLHQIDSGNAIAVYCSLGKRSEIASRELITQGRKNVYNVVGGLFKWNKMGYPIINKYGHKTDSIHVYNRLWAWLNTSGVEVRSR
jgi:rhodanese-related sulfurtransferase